MEIAVPGVAHYGQQTGLLDDVRGLDLVLADQGETDIEEG